MEDNIVIISEPEHTNIVIQGKEYEIKLIFSMHDDMELTQIDVDKEECCVRFVKDLICRHIVGNDRIEINDIPEESCIEYINLFLHSDKTIDRIYKSLDETLHPCKRFLLAQNELMHQMIESMKPTISKIVGLIQNLGESYTKSIKPIVENLHSIVDKYIDVYEKIINGISEQVNKLIDVFSNINIPQLSEADKQRIISRYVLWGDYGWTSTEFLSKELLDYKPVDISDANRTAKKLFNKQGVEQLFEQMELMGSINKADLAELKSCYYSRNYKACVLISFALIDAKLIRSQGKNANRRPGNTGIKRLESKINTDIEGAFLLTLSVTNLFHCLKKMFEDSENFKKQPVIINRHFIAHGMLHRKVLQRDAIQTVLLVYNLYYLTDFIEILRKDVSHQS